MSAAKVRDELLADLKAKKHDVIIVNFANGDMVGHTAKPEAIIKAVEVIDACLAQIIPVLLAQGGVALITADHGNAEEMLDQQGRPLTAHTTNLVPFVLVSQERAAVTLKSGGRLCDVAPTILQLLNLPKPAEMTGVSLLG
jgi:2,3-bisphosphoglycerate-independent phosphoglycerate mutase